MSLRCLRHERTMFGMFSTCSKPRKTIDNDILAALADFQYKFVKNDLFGLENDYQTHVIQNTMSRFVCVHRTDMIQKFLRAHEDQEVNFSAQSSKIQKLWMEKS